MSADRLARVGACGSLVSIVGLAVQIYAGPPSTWWGPVVIIAAATTVLVLIWEKWLRASGRAL